MELVIGGVVSIIVAVIAVSPAWYEARKSRKQSEATAVAIATNHGKRPGEYLELIAAGVNDLREGQDEVRAEVADLRATLGAHTESDAVNFAFLFAAINKERPHVP